jgi:hypothetical protein
MKNSALSQLIHRIRGRRVILSADLAKLYQVAPKALVQAVNRNRDRFPNDFLFQLDPEEARALREMSGAFGETMRNIRRTRSLSRA